MIELAQEGVEGVSVFDADPAVEDGNISGRVAGLAEGAHLLGEGVGSAGFAIGQVEGGGVSLAQGAVGAHGGEGGAVGVVSS